MRDSVVGRIEVLDKVKALVMLPDGLHVTTRMVAEYFEVGERVINRLAQRHREELVESGLRVLHGSDLQVFERDSLSLSKKSYPQGRAHLTVYGRRTVLNIAMLLRDSDVARRVRTYLLDIEAASRAPRPVAATTGSPGLVDLGRALQELGPVIGRISTRLDRVDHRLDHMDRRLDATNHIVAALSVRVHNLGEEVHDLRDDMRDVKSELRRRRR
ncbi:hypothetical protein [Streptomyces ochraceiscleroticus]|uniref:Uncharacterized protein n=1 Tax=Streptomyces ochraceiscleroticus TaxID=47761 RepID=A0ABW1MM43_9ACTN|nr:hypothetical protein [Streptomyces ochraceiscleroticus]